MRCFDKPRGGPQVRDSSNGNRSPGHADPAVGRHTLNALGEILSRPVSSVMMIQENQMRPCRARKPLPLIMAGDGGAYHRRLRAGCTLLALLALAGCAGARVSNIATSTVPGAPPTEILVAVDASQTADSAQSKVAAQVAGKLQSSLVDRLIHSRVTAEPFIAQTSHPGAAILHVSIVQADPGSFIERFTIGFGLGRAKLQARAELERADGDGAPALTAFDTASDSGMKPGLILPGGIALATGNAVHLAIGGGIDVAMNLRGGLARPTTSTASAIVAQLKKYYIAEGWDWPAADGA